jgi:hypothetical protein
MLKGHSAGQAYNTMNGQQNFMSGSSVREQPTASHRTSAGI